ncbi:hypothetical protein [Prosthecobacter sp.]|uniref:hypothetical protein n=1 Tax=Prosthecobacter sp. TaxID=1965333 RepID=UPI001D52ECE2|nr:hypothetical protein [Prosthecobacter sp.]MCB1276050.1 hypothetical protein [Prosthecobacter sp.]
MRIAAFHRQRPRSASRAVLDCQSHWFFFTRGALRVGLLGWMMAVGMSGVRADTLFLTKLGEKHLAEIRAQIAPIPVYEAGEAPQGMPRQPFFRGVIVGDVPARDVTADYETEEGRATLIVRAFTMDGTKASPEFRISDAWVKPHQELDSFYDLRQLASNRDEMLSTRIGSARFLGEFLNAIDPGGATGIGTGGAATAGEKLEEGRLIEELNPASSASASGQNQVAEFFQQRRLKERRSSAWLAWHWPQQSRDSDAWQWMEMIARTRRYGIYETGLDRAMLALLSARARLAWAKGDSPRATALRQHGFEVRRSVVDALRGLATTSATEQRLAQESRQGAALWLPVDLSEVGAAALDLCLARNEIVLPVCSADKVREEIRLLEVHPDYRPAQGLQMSVSTLSPAPAPGGFPASPAYDEGIKAEEIWHLAVRPPEGGLHFREDVRPKAQALLQIMMKPGGLKVLPDQQATADMVTYRSIDHLIFYTLSSAFLANPEGLMEYGGNEAEPLSQKLTRAYEAWRVGIGLLSYAEWPGRIEAYHHWQDDLWAQSTGIAERLHKASESGTVPADLELRLQHTLRCLRDLSHVGDSGGARAQVVGARLVEAWKRLTKVEEEEHLSEPYMKDWFKRYKALQTQ